MRTVVVSDMHNRLEASRDLFRMAGITDGSGDRLPDVHVIQLGDMLSLGYGEQESAFAEEFWPLIDMHLIGNHEYPALNSNPGIRFSGWSGRDQIAEQFVRSKFMGGEYQIATWVGDWLITHAGLFPSFMEQVDSDGTNDASSISEQLNVKFVDHAASGFRLSDRVFDAIGYQRGGRDQVGGVLWNDVSDLGPVYEKSENGKFVPQIIGHSSYNEQWQHGEDLWCIDSRSGVRALVSDDAGESWQLFESHGREIPTR